MAYTYSKYTESDAVKQAKQAMEEQAATKPSDYTSQWQSQINDTLDKILNRKEFSYDVNSDALYQQYKDQYVRQGKLAMQDTIGQAAALTGGYGNSYAEQAGQQAYQGYLTGLTDKIPELYQLALSKYQQEGEDLQNQYSLLSDQENTDYSRYQDLLSQWNTERDYLTDQYNTERDADYSQYTADRSLDYDVWQDSQSRAQEQVEALLAAGKQPSEELLAQADLTSEYANGIYQAYLEALAAQQAAAEAASSGSSGGGSSSSSDSELTLEEQYKAMKASGASQRQLDALLNEYKEYGYNSYGEKVVTNLNYLTGIRNGDNEPGRGGGTYTSSNSKSTTSSKKSTTSDTKKHNSGAAR